MKTYSQNTVAPPTPPLAIANYTLSGITYVKSKTDSQYAFSCTFNLNLKDKIITIITKEFSGFSDNYLNKEFKENEIEYRYKIELRDSDLKLEYEFKTLNNDDKKEIINKFNTIELAILEL